MRMHTKEVALPALIRKNLLDQLNKRGISVTADGMNIHDLKNRDLARVLAIAQYREKNVDSSDNKWF